MKRAVSVFKYMAKETWRSVLYYYIVILAIYFVMLPLIKLSGNGSVTGVDAASMIFLLVMGLNLFKQNFLFSQANGVTRKHFYAGSLMALAALAAVLTAVDAVLYPLARLIDQNVLNISSLVYTTEPWLPRFVWTFCVNMACVLGGWLITMIFYRSGKALKLVISIGVPVFLFIVLPILDSVTDGEFILKYSRFVSYVLFHTFYINAWAGSLFMLVVSGIASGFCYLLVRRAPVKSV